MGVWRYVDDFMQLAFEVVVVSFCKLFCKRSICNSRTRKALAMTIWKGINTRIVIDVYPELVRHDLFSKHLIAIMRTHQVDLQSAT